MAALDTPSLEATSGTIEPGPGSTTQFASAILFYLRKNPSILFGSIFALYVSQIAYCIFLHPLHHVPGPFLASFSKLWINIRHFRGTYHNDILEVHRQYGPVVRITPNEVSFVDREALKVLYSVSTGTRKSPWYSTWIARDLPHSMFATQDVDEHKFLRGRVALQYSMSSILPMEPFVQQTMDKLWSKFRKFAAAGQPIDMGDWVNYFAFDVVGELAMGGELGFLEQGKDVDGIIDGIHGGGFMLGNMGHVPLQMWWFNNPVSKWLFERFGPAELQAFPKFLKWLEARVVDRMKNGLGGRRMDMLQHFVEMKGSPSSPTESATKEDVMTESVLILGAGADTTAISIQTILGHLIMYPGVAFKLQQEIDQASRNTRLNETGRDISYNDATKLPYLCAVIKESMRLDPAFVYQLPRFAPEKGIQIGEYFVPEGMYAGVSPRAMNRSKDVFGKDAEQFVPERWIASSPEDEESIKEMTRLLAGFGLGSRVCIGQNIALVEIHKFVAQFVRHFELEVNNREKPWTVKSATFAFRSGFWVKLKER